MEPLKDRNTFSSIGRGTPSFSLVRSTIIGFPPNGFYEWTKLGKLPHFFTVNGGAPFAIAGIWDQGDDMPRCCLLTTTANAVLAPIHDRMPVIVRREDWEG